MSLLKLGRQSDSSAQIEQVFKRLFTYIEHEDAICQPDTTLLSEADDETAEGQFSQMSKILDDALGQIARDAYVLHGLELTYAQIGRQLNIDEHSVERYIADALTVLVLKR